MCWGNRKEIFLMPHLGQTVQEAVKDGQVFVRNLPGGRDF